MSDVLMYELFMRVPQLATFSPWLFSTAMIIVGVLMLFVAVRSVRHVWVAATLPVALVVVALSYVTIHSMMGQPTERMPYGDFIFLRHHVDPQQEWLYLWILEADNENPVTIKIPYDALQHQAASEAQQKVEQGSTQAGTLVTKTDAAGEPETGFEFHEFSNPGGWIDKEGNYHEN